MLRKDKVKVVSVHLKLVRGRLLVNIYIVVFGSISLLVHERRYRHTYINIGRSILSRIVLVGTVTEEGHYVFVHTKLLFVARLGCPPFKTFGTRRAATQMVIDGTIDMPFFAVGCSCTSGQEIEVAVEVCKGVVNVERLLDIVRRSTGRIHNVHTDGIVTHGGKKLGISAAGVIIRPLSLAVLENPYRIHTFCVKDESHDIGFLIDRDNRFESGSFGDISLGGMVNLFREACRYCKCGK